MAAGEVAAGEVAVVTKRSVGFTSVVLVVEVVPAGPGPAAAAEEVLGK
jgi:hypothetical protein